MTYKKLWKSKNWMIVDLTITSLGILLFAWKTKRDLKKI